MAILNLAVDAAFQMVSKSPIPTKLVFKLGHNLVNNKWEKYRIMGENHKCLSLGGGAIFWRGNIFKTLKVRVFLT